jgi:hypothetical protein
MTSLTIHSFYPDGLVHCEADLPLADGTYEIWDREYVLNIFEIKNRRIIYNVMYNTKTRERLITWIFEYFIAKDESQICNVWLQPPNTQARNMYSSTHWHLYPEEYKKREDHGNYFIELWDKMFGQQTTTQ